MRLKVLGSAAGGGFPQWNCACSNCSRFRNGSFKGSARSQTQLAFSPDNQSWFLLNASPDLRSQLAATPELAPGKNGPPLGGVFLPSADVDSVMGLLHLREFQPFFVFSTPSVQKALAKENRIFRVLERADPAVRWQNLSAKGRLGFHLANEPGASPDFSCTTIPLGGDYPDYVSDELQRNLPPDEAVVGFVLEKDQNRVLFAPSLSGELDNWRPAAETANLVLIDGTFWSDDELIQTGRSQKTARQIGHLPLSGPEGLLARFPKESTARKILIHINNTNPILDEESAEHRAVLDAGFEIAYDGMEFEL